MSKASRIALLVADRVQHGDYRVREFPSLAELADELGANPRTITKAVNELVNSGVLQRLATGRVIIPREESAPGVHLALLVPAYPSPHFALWHRAIQRLTRQRGWRVKPVSYTHWQDPAIASSLRGFEGVLFMPAGADIPPHVLKLIKESATPVVVLDQDVSSAGIPCLRFASATAVAGLLDLLRQRGHQRILCLNSQPLDSVIRERIDHFCLWASLNDRKPELLDVHVEPYDSAVDKAYSSLKERLAQEPLGATAIFCTTGAAALGAMRALREHGVEPGRDVAICAADDEAGRAEYLHPSLTCLKDPDWGPYLQVCLDWFGRGGKDWVGPLCVHPAAMRIYEGNSTPARP